MACDARIDQSLRKEKVACPWASSSDWLRLTYCEGRKFAGQKSLDGKSSECDKKRLKSRVVAKRFAVVRKAIHIARTKHKTPAQLKRIFGQQLDRVRACGQCLPLPAQVVLP